MFSQLNALVPGADTWPRFVRNRSEQFEARLVMVEVLESPSIFFTGMQGSRLPIVVAHGEGRVLFPDPALAAHVMREGLVALRYIDNHGEATEKYPFNPNGSPLGITALSSRDGRVTILMPHPERVFLRKQFSWIGTDWHGSDGPWLKIFQNARRWASST
jgi:phosphoribosylformylglycinamidine synthase